jgi:subtilisin family serine protease
VRAIVRTGTALGVGAALVLGAVPVDPRSAAATPTVVTTADEDPSAAEPERARDDAEPTPLHATADPDRGDLAEPPAAVSAEVAAATDAAAQGGEPAAASDRILVRFAPEIDPGDRTAALADRGTTAAEPVPGTEFVQVPTAGSTAAALVAELQQDPRVAEVQLDGVRTAQGTPDDALVPDAAAYLDLMRLPRAWDETTGVGTVIAVLDTGVDPHHPDLVDRLVPGYDAISGGTDTTDSRWHGTTVAGAAAASGDNRIGSAGAAYGARIMPVRVLAADGSGYDSDIAAGIEWAAEHGADVINLSLAGATASPVLRDAVQHAVDAGAVVLAAAGDSGTEVPQYPAAYAPEIAGLLSVGATDDTGALTEFSSWGDSVTITAPGVEIVAPSSSSGRYTSGTGTSFSTPLVSGVAALLASTTEGPAQVEATLIASARDAGPRGHDPHYGAGVVDAAAALGLGAATPLDRAAGDSGPDDSVPARARALALGATRTASLSPEGDEDWFAVPAPAPGWYAVTVRPAGGLRSTTRPRVTVLSAGGEILGTDEATDVNQPVSLTVPVLAGGTLRVGVSNVVGAAGEDYTVQARATGKVGLTRVAGDAVTSGWERYLTVGDLTGDGRPDVVSSAHGAAVATTMLRPGHGDGTFGAPVPVPTGTLGGTVRGLAVADLDADGDEDLFLSTTHAYAVIRQRDGALVPDAPVSERSLNWLTTGDLDGDGAADVVATRGLASVVLRNDGTGTFAAPVQTGQNMGGRVVGDITGDGRPDVVGSTGHILRQEADGSFTILPGPPGHVGESWWPGLGDVTGDGNLDLVQVAAQGLLRVVPGRGGGAYAAPRETRPWTDEAESANVGDVDGDGRSDVIVPEPDHGGIWVATQRTDGTLAVPWAGILHDPDRQTEGATVVEDVTGDGLADVVRAGTTLEAWVATPLAQAAGTGTTPWITSTSVTPGQAGVDIRPTLTVTVGRGLAAGAVSASTVRLSDVTAGGVVPAAVGYDPASGTVSLTPDADLTPGRHYQLWVGGLTDASGAVQPRPSRVPFTVAADGARFTPADPWRVLDTRIDIGATGPVSPSAPIRVDLGDRVPADATAVVLNVTAVDPAGAGWVRVYPTPNGAQAAPAVSNLNVVAGVTQANAVTVALGAGGDVSFAGSTTADLLADVAGYYRAGGVTGYTPLDPVRVMDTRTGAGGVPQAGVRGGRFVDLVVTGREGVPADASAVVLNVTGIRPSAGTNVRVFPTPAASASQVPPQVSNLNLVPGRALPNLVTVKVGDGGRVRFWSQSGTVDLAADLAGYYSPTGAHGFVPLAPARIADSRQRVGVAGALRGGVPSRLVVAGAGGVPADAAAAVLNVTAVKASASSDLRIYPAQAGGAIPLVSHLNMPRGRDEPNLVATRLGTAGAVQLYARADTHVVVDVSGYFRQ